MNHDEHIYETIYQVIRQIPRGRVSTYGAIAAAIGMRSGARMVGYALNNCHNSRPQVPAHRVVNRQGLLTGKHHFAAPDQMKLLLEKEGVKIIADKVVDFDAIFWDPAQELG
jgi:methylated-DNA-protein-cysteine methyltransferase-like protein